MKWILYTIIVAVTVAFAPYGTDVGKLQPIEIIAVSKQDNVVMIETDTGDSGKGETLGQAFQDMRETSAGIVIPDTAEYLLLGEGGEEYIEELKGMLKGNVRVCVAWGEKDLVAASEYLNIHGVKMKLKDAKAGNIKQKLMFENNEEENLKKMKIILDK